MFSKLTLFLAALSILATVEAYPSRYKSEEAKYENDDVGEPLILTPFLESGKIDEARSAAKVSLGGVAKDVESYSGYFTVNKQYDSNLFFWFFPSKNDYKNDPVVLWLQGGPGSPSLTGLFLINGPFEVNDDTQLELREYSWHNNQSVLYIDQPVGTGLSFTKHEDGFARNQTRVGEELYDALQQFFRLFPELRKNDFFMTGESYAGKYIPTLAHTILKHNSTAAEKINVQGLAIGNGFIDPKLQTGYAEYLYQIGLVDAHDAGVIKEYEDKAVSYISQKKYNESNEQIYSLFDYLYNVSGDVDIYNYIYTGYIDTTPMKLFLNTTEARRALHYGNVNFDLTEAYNRMKEDMQRDDVTPWFIEAANNFRMMLYAGQVDIRVAYPLTQNFLKNVKFNDSEKFHNATRKIWYVDEDVAGYYKTAGKFTDVLVRSAGHMVPLDQPKVALDLINKFVRNQPLGS
nr:unnamed protein product [Callosobruchus chinensis]